MPVSVIEGLKPALLWKRFYEISQVPHPSKKEAKIVEHMKKLFSDSGIEFKEDNVGNLVAAIPPTPGCEDAPTVILQGHVDMVCEKNKDTRHDFDNDPLNLIYVDGWIKADGTTLGGDNGIGVAAALALIDDKESVHGPLEILLTVDEETGLTGAKEVPPGFFTGSVLLNLDSEEEGAFSIGCAGGTGAIAHFELELADAPSGLAGYELLVSGLKGGHSGLDIHRGRANAIKILARALSELEGIEFHVASVSGGSKRNAIPREAEALICLDPSHEAEVVDRLRNFTEKLRDEFMASDSGLKVDFKRVDSTPQKVFGESFLNRMIHTLMALPHGVIAMSQDFPGLVETSTNLATIATGQDELTIETTQRSSVESAKKYIAENVRSVFKLAGARVESGNEYPGWKPNPDSNILKVSRDIYQSLYNQDPEMKAMHAGVECGILGDKSPGLDMISFGPTIMGAHSPDERVEVGSVERFYELLKAILKELAMPATA